MGLRSQEFQKIGELDVSRLQNAVSRFGPERWGEDQWRQETFKPHESTETLPIIFDKDFRHVNPTFHPLFFEMQDVLRDAFSRIKGFFGKDGYVIRCILAKLRAQSEVTPHKDYGPSLLSANRIHIPLLTNEQVVFQIGDCEKNLRPGEIWRIDNGDEHAVRNPSDQDRVHMIIDWVDWEATKVASLVKPALEAERARRGGQPVANEAFIVSMEECLSRYGDQTLDEFGDAEIRDVLERHEFAEPSETKRARSLWADRWNRRSEIRSPDHGFSFDVNPLVARALQHERGFRKALEIGSGAGSNCVFLARNGIETLGVDLCTSAVEAARAASRDLGAACSFLDSDIFDYDPPAGGFDLVVDANCFQTIPFYRVETYIEKIRDALVPGGRFLLLCPSADHRITNKNSLLPYTRLGRLISYLHDGYTETEFTRSELVHLLLESFNFLGMHMMRNEAIGAAWHALILARAG